MWRELSRAAVLLWAAWALAESAAISERAEARGVPQAIHESPSSAAGDEAGAHEAGGGGKDAGKTVASDDKGDADDAGALTAPTPSTSRVLDAQNIGTDRREPQSTATARASQLIPSLAPLVQRVRPTVVEVMTTGGQGFWSRLMSALTGQSVALPHTIGSGVLISPDGIILTNDHVIDGAADILVRLEDGRELEARLVGRDPETDVALLRLLRMDETITFAELGDSRSLRVGDFVVAIGNPFGLPLTVTYGIISGTARELGDSPFDSYLQTDAAINPGNSGGPLFDLDGRVVGINTAIVDQADGIGFAVPSALIRTLLPLLVEHGQVRRGFLGASARNLLDEELRATNLSATEGACIRSIHRDGPADEAGLQPGDIVIGIEGERVLGAAHLIRRVSQFQPGQSVRLQLLRDGVEEEVVVELGERPRP